MPGATWAIIPVKPLDEGKSRLGQELTNEGRAQLTLEMLDAVIGAVRGARGLAGWVVVSRDEVLLSHARRAGGNSLAEPGRGLNRALEEARRWCCAQGADGVLVLHADLPLLRTSEVEQMLESGGDGRRLVLAPSFDGTGTNGLLARPADLIRYAFGPDSLSRHVESARQLGITPHLYYAIGTACDVDTPADLQRWRLDQTHQVDADVHSHATTQTIARRGVRA